MEEILGVKEMTLRNWKNSHKRLGIRWLNPKSKRPIKTNQIQIDGGSKFMGNFEQACKNNNISLFVLPPKSPKLNGGIKRINRII